MLNPAITEQVRKLSPAERIDLIEYVFELNRIEKPKKKKSKNDSLKELLLSLAEAGEEALQNGAQELPSDFATNHDKYLYGRVTKD